MVDKAKECQQMANRMRMELVDMARMAGGPVHWGGSFSSMEIFAVLFKEVLNCADKTLDDIHKDKFLLSKGHAAPALYTAMHQVGMLTDEQMLTYQQDGSRMPELMEANKGLGFETSGGSLGINPSYAVGLALLAKKKGYTYKVYVEVGDGEMDEGNVWEAVMAAAQYRLDNLTMIIDANAVQLSGRTDDIISWKNLRQCLESFGWQVASVNGHDCMELLETFTAIRQEGFPFAVIANTVKGKGLSFMENDYHWHDGLMAGEDFENARREMSAHDNF